MNVTVPSLAKINLGLRVLHKRSDGYHELRTIFQTISLADRLQISYEHSRRTTIAVESSIEIQDNLVLRAARLVCDRFRIRARIGFKLDKRIPMGAGLGGGSSNAAAVLNALPVLAGRQTSLQELADLAGELGSDIPFFIYGGTALGLGRGTELYPLPEQPSHHVVVVAPGVHVSTAEAYKVLDRDVTNALTSPREFPILREFQAIAWALDGTGLSGLALTNDFEKPVFAAHPSVAAAVRKLARLGALFARMTGSGSSVFGVFESRAEAENAVAVFNPGTAFRGRFVSRARYQAIWRRALSR